MSTPIEFTPHQKIERYIALRDKIDEMQKAFDLQCQPYVEAMKAIEASLQNDLNEAGADNIKTPAGTVYRKLATSTKVVNWESFLEFVQEAAAWELLVHGANKTTVREYAEEHQGQLPPGVEISSINVVQVRRA